jgi:hypothetical protein
MQHITNFTTTQEAIPRELVKTEPIPRKSNQNLHRIRSYNPLTQPQNQNTEQHSQYNTEQHITAQQHNTTQNSTAQHSTVCFRRKMIIQLDNNTEQKQIL